MIRKIVFISLLFVLLMGNSALANDEINEIINNELKDIKISEFNILDFKNQILEDGKLPDIKGIFKMLIDFVLKEASESTKTLIVLIVPILLMGIISNLSIKDEGVMNMANITSYLAISGIIVYVFSDATRISRETIDNIDIMSNSMIPVLYSIMLTMGKVTTYTAMHPTVIFLIRIIMLIIKNGMFPLVMLSFALSITDNILERENFKRISSLILKLIKWVLIFLITLFTTILSTQNILTHSFDTVAMKGTKFAVANFVPIVGGAISDGVETIGSSLILIKNATGIAGIAGVIVIALLPVIRIYLISLTLYILSSISQLVSNERIAKILDNSGSNVSMLGAIVICVSFLFIISVAVMLGG